MRNNEMVEFDKLVFKSVKLRMQNESCLEDVRAVGFEYFIDDYSRRLITRLELEMHERIAEEKEVEFLIERPKFLDWLLRRQKTKKVKVILKDILKGSSANINGQPYIEVIQIKPKSDEI